MKLLIEEYQYDAADVADVLEGLFTLQDINNKVSVSYVGFYYNSKIKDCVFVLPKVLIDEHGLVFGKYNPAVLINHDEANLETHEKKFLYEFAVWIHRAIVVYQSSHQDNGIVLCRQIESEGSGAKKKSNTLLDVIFALIRFNKENRSFFTFILKNIHSGFNKINWGKTISSTTAVVQGDDPVYVNPVNKKRQVNFDEELIVIFFSILNYISEKFGFRTEIPFGFKLIAGSQFERYINGFGARRLRQIKYKYYSDRAVELWGLCYAFFDKAYQIKMSVDKNEYLLVKSFHIVFEAIIDDLIGDDDIPNGLKEQEDGKLVDHFYTYQGLVSNRPDNNDVYYIGDSKYYKIGSNPGKQSVYKQYTYARNVIQWNLNLFLEEEKNLTVEERILRNKDKNRFEKIQLRDEITEGYNIIPNFFISADINPVTLSYEDKTVEHNPQPPLSRHFNNRLYDRDTLLLSHYDVNFLFVLSLYARNNAGAKESYKVSVRKKFRESIHKILNEKFKFYAIQAHSGVNSDEYFKTHFKDVIGKVFSPYIDKEIFSLALDRSDSKNQELIDQLKQDFYVAECELGEEPSSVIEREIVEVGEVVKTDYSGMFLTCLVRKSEVDDSGTGLYDLFANHSAEGKTYVMQKMPSGAINEVRYLLPILDNSITGYYEVADVKFGFTTRHFSDSGETVSVKIPNLRIKIGQYHSFGKVYTKGVVPNMSNQIWSANQLKALLDKTDSSVAEELYAEEPEAGYGFGAENGADYVED